MRPVASIPVLAILSLFCFFLSSVVVMVNVHFDILNKNHKLRNILTSVMSSREGNDVFLRLKKATVFAMSSGLVHADLSKVVPDAQVCMPVPKSGVRKGLIFRIR